jgi:hypothetical protein
MVSLKNKAEEINAAQIEKGKEQKRIDELNKLILLTNKHKDELDKIYNEKGEVTYDADMLLSDLTLKVAALEESIRGAAQQAALGRQLTQDELDEAEAAYRNYVPGAVEKIMGSGAEYDCADFAIAVLEDFAKNYKNEELKLALYNSAGAVTSNYGPQISAEHLALYNTKEVSGKADVGDMLIYDWGTGKWHAIVIYRRQDIVSGQTCIYRLAMGNLEEGTPTKIAFVDGTGIASEDQYAGEDYNRYVKWLTSGGDKGKFLYKNAPRQWDFAKILRVQEAA